MFKSLTIGKKIAFGFGCVLFLLVITGVVGLVGTTRLGTQAVDVIEKNALIEELQQREIDHLNWADAVGQFLVDETLTEVSVQTNPHKCAFGKWYYGDGRQAAEASVPALASILKEIEGHHTALHESAVHINKILAEQEKAVSHVESPIEYARTMSSALPTESRIEAAKHHYVSATKPSLEQVQHCLKAACEEVEHEVESVNHSMHSMARTTKIMVIVLLVGAVVLGVGLAFVIGRSIVQTLKRIIGKLQEGAEQVASASGEITSASQSLAQGATEQAAGLEETSSSLEEMASMTRQNADNAQQGNTLATTACKAAEGGSEAMTRMSSAIGDIQKSSDETAKIIKVIDEIAFQTNLLALNAAVEAARAGEAGKGFAVVAEEVRNLAMRSAEAAKNTSNLIEESVKNSKNGVEIVSEVGKMFEEITGSIAKTSDLVGEIAAASQEQSQGIDQINTAVTQMDKVTQQNAANAEQSASAAEELSSQAQTMEQQVQQLSALVGARIDGGGNHRDRIGSRQVSGPRRPASTHTDRLYHDISQGKSLQGTPAEVLPLEASEEVSVDEFKEFNN